MKRITTLVALMAAAMAMTAAVGAASASAQSTVFCETPRFESTYCPAGKVMPAGTSFHVGSTAWTDGLRIKSNGTTVYHCGNYMRFESTAESATYWLPAATEFKVNAETCKFREGAAGSCSSATLGGSGATLNPWNTGFDTLIRVGSSSPMTFSFTCTNPGGPTLTCQYAAQSTVGLAVDSQAETAVTSSEALDFVAANPPWYAWGAGCGKGTTLTLSIDDITHGGAPYVSVIP